MTKKTFPHIAVGIGLLAVIFIVGLTMVAIRKKLNRANRRIISSTEPVRETRFVSEGPAMVGVTPLPRQESLKIPRAIVPGQAAQSAPIPLDKSGYIAPEEVSSPLVEDLEEDYTTNTTFLTEEQRIDILKRQQDSDPDALKAALETAASLVGSQALTVMTPERTIDILPENESLSSPE